MEEPVELLLLETSVSGKLRSEKNALRKRDCRPSNRRSLAFMETMLLITSPTLLCFFQVLSGEFNSNINGSTIEHCIFQQPYLIVRVAC